MVGTAQTCCGWTEAKLVPLDCAWVPGETDDVFFASAFVQAVEQHPVLCHVNDEAAIQNITDDVIDQVNGRDPLAGWFKRRHPRQAVCVRYVHTLRSVATAIGYQSLERIAR